MTFTAAVVVAFHPDPAVFRALLARLRDSCEAVIVQDNGNDTAVEALCREAGDVRYEASPRNLGVAAALNRGAGQAWTLGASHVLLCDHDSLPEAGMLLQLHRTLAALEATGERVAAVGPRYSDRLRSRNASFHRVVDGRLTLVEAAEDRAPLRLDYLITSGSLISRTAWNLIGPMNERLFIDYVDIEWGLRARRLGWACFGDPAAGMSHAIGVSTHRILGRDITVHSPQRLYYQTRNAIHLLRRPDVPGDWKRAIRASMLPRALGFPILVAPRLQNLRMILRGLYDGLGDRLGPIGPG